MFQKKMGISFVNLQRSSFCNTYIFISFFCRTGGIGFYFTEVNAFAQLFHIFSGKATTHSTQLDGKRLVMASIEKFLHLTLEAVPVVNANPQCQNQKNCHEDSEGT